MHIIPFEIPPPKNEADFERMCAQVYGVVFDDRTPKINGRRGQVQGGVDIFVKEPGIGRVGIQCKKYTLKPVTWKDVEDEIKKADQHKTPITKLILATTAPNDAVLLKQVLQLSDNREAAGLFSIEIEFWDDICNRIDQFTVLQDSYAPQAPGAAYHRQEAALSSLQEIAVDTKAAVISLASLPSARHDSADRIISGQLDLTNVLLKAGKYRDALAHLESIGKDLQPFDAHQKARWHLQRGLCLWFGRTGDAACAELFLKAFELFPDDERMAAAQVRGLMIQGRLDEALTAGTAGQERFPDSQQVWFSLANVRLLRGEHISMADVPVHLKSEPDTLQFIAQAQLKAGNLGEAIRLSQLAANDPSAGFFIRAAALRIAAECGSRHPLGAAFAALPERELKALQFAAEQFEPRHERLWVIQSESIEEAATHLCYVLLMLLRFDDALALAREAEARGLRSPELLRVHATALFELDREGELVTLAESRLPEMNASALAVVGQVAAKQANLALLTKAAEAAASAPQPDAETVELLGALQWDALARAGRLNTAVNEILSAKVEDTGGLVSCCVAAQVLTRAGRALEAKAVVDRAKTLVSADSSAVNKLNLAELLFTVGQWTSAGALFEQLATSGPLSELHNRLLACHVRSHSRKRAKELIGNLPAGWIENDETRSLAIELGQQAADWEFLRPLVEAQVKKEPARAGSWLFKMSVSLHSATPAEFQNDLRSVPEVLDGPVRALAQLSNLELRYGEVARGMRRLYRMVRKNMDEPEALSAYFISIVAGRTDLPSMEVKLPAVVPGSSITLQDEFGHVVEVVIDPDDVGELPNREGFFSTESAQAVALKLSVPGQAVDLPTRAFGETRRYTVTAVQSAYRKMLAVAQERANAVAGLPNMKMMPVGSSGDGEMDLTYIKAEVKRFSEISREIFDGYAKGLMTIGGFAHLQGRAPVEAAIGWPVDGPPLFVATGTEEERAKGLALLERQDAVYVIDSLTLAELVNLGVQDVLSKLPKVLVSPVTKALFEQKLREAQDDRSIATTFEVGGKLAFVEHGPTHHARRIEFCKELLSAVDMYCVVQPAYGELEASGDLPSLADVLQDEELEVLMLATAQEATLLTLDGRLRNILEFVSKLPGIWPQLLLMHCGRRGLIEPARIAAANVRQFLTNRTFVSLCAADLVWMLMQGGAYLENGMQRFKTYLSSSGAEFKSTAAVAFEFLATVARMRTHLGAFGEVFEHVMEALLRHPQRSPNFLEDVSEFVDELTERLSGGMHPYALADAQREQRVVLQRRYLANRCAQSYRRSSEPQSIRPIEVRVLYCSKIPWLVEDKPSKAPDSETNRPAASEPRSEEAKRSPGDEHSDAAELRKQSAIYLVPAPPSDRT